MSPRSLLSPVSAAACILVAALACPNASGQCIQELGEWGDTGFQDRNTLRSSYSLVATDTQVYVLDEELGCIDIFSPEGTAQGRLGPFAGPGALNKPHGLILHPNGDFYVLDSADNRVARYTPDGTFVSAFGDLGDLVGQFRQPQDLAADAAGNIYVADTGNRRIQVFTEDGVWLRSWGKQGSAPHEFLTPSALEIHPQSGLLYVADSGFIPKVKIFSTQGIFMAAWGEQGSLEPDRILAPTDLAFDTYGNVYLVDSRLKMFTPTGEFICQSGIGSYWGLRAAAISPGGELFVFHARHLDPTDGPPWTRHQVARATTLPAPPPPPPEILDGSALTLHLQAGRDHCYQAPVLPGDVVTSGDADGSDYTVYVLADNSRLSGVGGIQFGIDYGADLEVDGWTSCSALSFRGPDWPGSGTGNILTWDALADCQEQPLVVAGFFYVRAEDTATMSLAKYPVGDAVEVTNCFFQSIPLDAENLGWIALNAPGGEPGGLNQGCNALLGPCPEFEALPTGWALRAPAPNPFKGEAFLSYALPADTQVTIRVYDAQGRVVRVLEDSWHPAGEYDTSWDGTLAQGGHASAGVYFMSMETGAGVRQSRRVVLLP